MKKLTVASVSKSCRFYSGTSSMCSKRRVVCTGIGVVTPLGCGINHVWKNLIEGKIGVVENKRPDFINIPSKVAAFVPCGNEVGQFNLESVIKKGDSRFLSLSMIYALDSAEQATKDADWQPTAEENQIDTGVAIGCGMIDLQTVAETSNTLKDKGYRRVSPYFVPKILINMASGHVSIKYKFKGPNHSVSTACTTGAHAIGDAMRFIRNGDAKVMVCGGTDAAISPVSVAGFARAKALSSSFTSNPETSSRPFDKARDGFVIGEGAGIIVLEEYEHAKERNAKMYAEILGYGLSGDGFHMTAPSADGIGAYLCMKSALRDASITPDQISYINAHATSTPLGDVIENRAIKRVFQEHSYNLKVSSCKGAFGHLLGAAGAVETAMTIMALKGKTLPPTMNLFNVDKNEGLDLDYVPNEAKSFIVPRNQRRIALKNSFGFGGTNASLCLAEL